MRRGLRDCYSALAGRTAIAGAGWGIRPRSPPFKDLEMKKPYAKAGALLINAALWLFWLKLWWWSLGAFAAVGLIDLYLVKRGKPTISMWVWDRWKPAGDAVVMVSVFVTTWAVLGLPMAVAMLSGIVTGHLRWQSGEEE